MLKTVLSWFAGILLTSTAMAATPSEVTATIHHFIDAFNSGDQAAIYAAYAPGTVTIVDEFAPHLWSGVNAAHEWAADYDKHAAATGVTDGVVKYSEPNRSVVDGDTAYVVVPAVYDYKEHGKAIAEQGRFTFVLRAGTAGWKIQGWTWTGAIPQPATK